MKVELLVNLKIASGKVISAGTIYSDENVPIPEFIMRRLERGTARVIDAKPSSIPKAPAVSPGSKAAAKAAEAKAAKDAEILGDQGEAFVGNNFPKTVKRVLNKAAKE